MANDKLTLITAVRSDARVLAGALQDLIEPPPDALTLFESKTAHGVEWVIEAYYEELPDLAALATDLAAITGLAAPRIEASEVPSLNWVAMSQAALPPVYAGRFVIYGSHDAGRIARGPGAILVEAGEAFGTAHHATTYGCLLALDRLTRQGTFRTVLDLGCGTGVLAIAASRALPNAVILATDLDRQSVSVARANFAANGAAQRIKAVAASGFAHPEFRRRPPFELILANILAGPLMAMAGDFHRHTRADGRLILSGILIDQAPEVISAFAARGFALLSHERYAGWSTLILVNKGFPRRGEIATS